VTSTLTAELGNGVTGAAAPAGSTGPPATSSSIQPLRARSDTDLRAERSQRISSKGRRAGVVKCPLGMMGSLLATSPVCHSESKAGVQQVLSRVDTLLAAVWEGFALGQGHVDTQRSWAVKLGMLCCMFLPSPPRLFCTVNVDHKILRLPLSINGEGAIKSFAPVPTSL